MIRAETTDKGVEVQTEGEVKEVLMEFYYLANSLAGEIAKRSKYPIGKILNVMVNSLKEIADSYNSSVNSKNGGGFIQ